jgi:hypothetical protein
MRIIFLFSLGRNMSVHASFFDYFSLPNVLATSCMHAQSIYSHNCIRCVVQLITEIPKTNRLLASVVVPDFDTLGFGFPDHSSNIMHVYISIITIIINKVWPTRIYAALGCRRRRGSRHTELEGTKSQPPWSLLSCRFRFVPEAVGPFGQQRREERKVEEALPKSMQQRIERASGLGQR